MLRPAVQVGLPQDQWLHMTKGQAAGGAAGAAVEGKPEAGEAAPAEQGTGAEQEGQQPAEGQQQQEEGQQQAKEDKAAQAPRSNLSDATTLEQLRAVGMGCCVAVMRHADAVALGFAGETEGDAGGRHGREGTTALGRAARLQQGRGNRICLRLPGRTRPAKAAFALHKPGPDSAAQLCPRPAVLPQGPRAAAAWPRRRPSPSPAGAGATA